MAFRKFFCSWRDFRRIEKIISATGKYVPRWIYKFYTKNNQKFDIELSKKEVVDFEDILIRTNKFNFDNESLLGPVNFYRICHTEL